MIRFMESDPHNFIVDYLMSEFRGIYLETQSSTYTELLNRLSVCPEAKTIDDVAAQRFQQTLKSYSSYLSSELFPSEELRGQTSSDFKENKTSSHAKTTNIEGTVYTTPSFSTGFNFCLNIIKTRKGQAASSLFAPYFGLRLARFFSLFQCKGMHFLVHFQDFAHNSHAATPYFITGSDMDRLWWGGGS